MVARANKLGWIPSQILIYTRPWETRFHIKLGLELRERLGGVPLKFATFFWRAHRLTSAEGLPCIYMPWELRTVRIDKSLPDPACMQLDETLIPADGTGLLLMLHMERFLPRTGPLAEEFLVKHCAVLDRLVAPRTLSVSSMYDHFVYVLAGCLANRKQGAHFAFVSCGVPGGRVLALKTPWATWESPEIHGYGPELALDHVRETLLLPSTDRIDYMMPVVRPPLRSRWRTLLSQLYAELVDGREGSYFAHRRPWTRFVRSWSAERTVTHNEALMDLRKGDPLPSGAFVYIPLHMEPEASILMYSPWLRDQLELVRLVAQAVPYGTRIVVKENPKMLAMRPHEFLRKMKSIPGVLLAHPEIPTAELILRAVCTVTLAGTASLEAAILGRPSLVVGKPPFVFLSPSMSVSPGPELHQRVWAIVLGRSAERPGIAADAWRRWLRATFPGSAVPTFRRRDGTLCSEPQIPDDSANVQAYIEYILSCLEQCQRAGV